MNSVMVGQSSCDPRNPVHGSLSLFLFRVNYNSPKVVKETDCTLPRCNISISARIAAACMKKRLGMMRGSMMVYACNALAPDNERAPPNGVPRRFPSELASENASIKSFRSRARQNLVYIWFGIHLRYV
jgi:hypothetical protein